MATITLKNAYIAQPAATDTTLYTCPDNTSARVVKCTITNDTTTAETISFHKVPASDAVGDDVLIMNGRTIGPKETYSAIEIEGQILDAGDVISAIAGAASQLTVSLDVVEMT